MSPDPALRAVNWRSLLRPLVPIYAAGLAAKNLAYARHWLPNKRLRAPVISIGNLSVGGAGKTPLVIRLAELLCARGFAVDVLSRGYGRRSSTPEQVSFTLPGPASDQEGDRRIDQPAGGAERYGDEPILIAQACGVPVYVGASRYEGGLLAEQRPAIAARVHLLDDGFQHRRLARAVDIVLLHRTDFEQGLLPAGRLREPLSSLGRASIVVLRVEDAECEPALRLYFAGPVWWITREIMLPTNSTFEAATPAMAFCGIAHPREFFASLVQAGITLADTVAFRDHHAYTDADIAQLVERGRARGARRLLTTEKDLIRLSGRHRVLLKQAAPLEAVPLRARLLEEEASIAQLLVLANLSEPSLPPATFERTLRAPAPKA